MQHECPGCAVKRGAEPDKTAALCAAHNAAYDKLKAHRGKDNVKKTNSNTRKSKETPLESGEVPGHVPHGVVVDEFMPAATTATEDADDAMPWEDEDENESAQEPASAENAPPAETTAEVRPRGTSGRVLKARAPNERLHRPRDAKRMIERFAAEASTERWDWERMGADPSVVGGLLARLLDLGMTLRDGGSGSGKLIEGATIRAKADSELAEVWRVMYGTTSARVIKVTRNEARQLKCLAVDIDGIPLAVFGAQLKQIELATAKNEDEAS